mmetsp:Transcript_15027/g.30953  ORF Transcript_15027/g.30953 Transcript_15027/m.30953 type:complete len:583 (+) Transcript_15027:3857-5605(+)
MRMSAKKSFRDMIERNKEWWTPVQKSYLEKHFASKTTGSKAWTNEHFYDLDFGILEDDREKIVPKWASTLTLLSRVSLVRPHIERIQEGAFSDNEILKEIEIRQAVDLATIEPGSLPPSLESLYLSTAVVEKIHNGTLQNFNNLWELRLQNTHLRELEIGAIEGCGNLSQVLLNANWVERAADVVKAIASAPVNGMELKSNPITTIDSDAFAGLSALEDLTMSYNNVLHLSDYSFRGLDSLNRLFLNEGKLEGQLSKGVFTGLETKLTLLDLSANALSDLEEGMFAGLMGLKYLYLGRNNLRRIRGGLWPDGVVEVNLFGNALKTLEENSFANLDGLEAVVLHGNNITEISENAFGFSNAWQGQELKISIDASALGLLTFSTLPPGTEIVVHADDTTNAEESATAGICAAASTAEVNILTRKNVSKEDVIFFRDFLIEGSDFKPQDQDSDCEGCVMLHWDEAQEYCQSIGRDLYSVDSPANQALLEEFEPQLGDEPLHIGCRHEGNIGRWVWVDGTPWGFANWESTHLQPNIVRSAHKDDIPEFCGTTTAKIFGWKNTGKLNWGSDRPFLCGPENGIMRKLC